jgi:hypothetical protein
VIKKISLWKTEFRDVWIRFLLNEALYTDESKVFELPFNIELIKIILFWFERQLTKFKYLDHEFCLILNNDQSIGDIESELKYKARLGSEVSFYGFADRKLQKREFLYEHSTITLMRTNKRAKTEECKLVDV